MLKGLLDPKIDCDEKDMLVAWNEFLKNPESEKTRDLEMSIDEIKEAKDELIRLSNNKEERSLYEMRSKILKYKVSALNKAEQEGIEKGELLKVLEIAKNLLDILEDETISQKTGLIINKVKELRE